MYIFGACISFLGVVGLGWSAVKAYVIFSEGSAVPTFQSAPVDCDMAVINAVYGNMDGIFTVAAIGLLFLVIGIVLAVLNHRKEKELNSLRVRVRIDEKPEP